ncbi:MAG: replicative DNA helicase [Saprospiraceae bacterium]|nr:replicative DNA helicase [Saprospiraceae bacterium]MDW8484390.1 replicative DNA helicase [Saprospiraceae bacterium]
MNKRDSLPEDPEARKSGGRARKGTRGEEGLSNYVFGKVQPQALELEEAVLGALMLERDVLPIVMDILRPESFYHPAHQAIYRAIIRLFERSYPVDLLTVTEELRRSGELEAAGGSYYLVELTNRVASAANAEYHARIIAQKHILREMIRLSSRTIEEAYKETTDVFSLLDETEKGLFAITQNNLSRTFESLDVLAGRVLREVETLAQRSDGLTGIPSGFTDVDRITCGWQPSDLIILAARPGMGKTACVLTMALNAARDFGKPVAIFSLEMASIQLAQRLFSMASDIPGPKIRNARLEDYEWARLQSTAEQLSHVPIYIDDTPGINIFELRAKCRRLKIQHNIQLVIIDYLQLMSGAVENYRNTNREQEIASISRALKNMAKELNVPVIALSQLSRAVEVRGGTKRPQLSDLRESGAIEQDADIVAFLYRPDYYGIVEDESGRSVQGIVEFIIAKHRHGATDTVRLRFVRELSRFENIEDPIFATLKDPIDLNALGPGSILDSKINRPPDDVPF